jgi:hypothetical protein
VTGEIVVHQGELIDVGPRYDTWNCVHTEPPTRVFLDTSRRTALVDIFNPADNPHDNPDAKPVDFNLFGVPDMEKRYGDVADPELVSSFALRAIEEHAVKQN